MDLSASRSRRRSSHRVKGVDKDRFRANPQLRAEVLHHIQPYADSSF